MIKTFTAAVAAQEINITPLDIYVSRTGGVYECEFTFDSTWTGFTKKAVFKNRYGEREEADIESGSCTLPESAITPGRLQIGVYGTDGSAILPTRWASIEVHIGVLSDPYRRSN